MRVKNIISALFLQAALLVTACVKPEPLIPDSITIISDSRTDNKLDKNGGSFIVNFESANPWEIAVEDESWVSVTPMSGKAGKGMITVTVRPTTLETERTCEVTIMSGFVSEVVYVVQKNIYESHLYKVVAHRGGYMENGFPESSIAGLKYSIENNCYACETDVFITADDSVLCVHSNHETDFNLYNDLDISEKTLAEMRASGTLSNGEQLPCLEDFLEILSDPEQNPLGTKLWLDVKGKNTGLNLAVIYKCAEIAKKMNATQYIEFLVTQWLPQYTTIRSEIAAKYGIPCAWNFVSDIKAPSDFGEAGWAQLKYQAMKEEGVWPPSVFYNAKPPVEISIFYTVSSLSKYSDFYVDVFPYYKRLKAIFTNYPKDCIDNLIKKGYDTPCE